jgi:hypothetical protein
MEIKIYFSIVSNDGVTIGVGATAMLSGSYIPADFNHDIEDNREIDVTEVNLFDKDSEEINSEKLTEITYEHIDDNLVNIFNKAVKHIDEIYLDDFKSDHDYAALMQ